MVYRVGQGGYTGDLRLIVLGFQYELGIFLFILLSVHCLAQFRQASPVQTGVVKQIFSFVPYVQDLWLALAHILSPCIDLFLSYLTKNYNVFFFLGGGRGFKDSKPCFFFFLNDEKIYFSAKMYRDKVFNRETVGRNTRYL